MTTKTRDLARKELAVLLNAALVGTGLPVTAVYNYLKGHLAGESPVILVTSGRIRRDLEGIGAGKFDSNIRLNLLVMVADAKASAGITELEVDDLIDQIEGGIANVVAANQNHSPWIDLNYAEEPSEPLPGQDLDGHPYVIEIIKLEARLYDD